MNRRLLIPLFISFLFLSCTPKENSPSDNSPSGDKAEMNEQNSPADTAEDSNSLRLTKTSEAEDEEGRSGSSELSAEQLPEFTGPMALQRIKSQAYILPSSLMIGELADPWAFSQAERDVYNLAESFWRAYGQGDIPGSLISSDAHPLFEKELNEFRELAPGITGTYSGSVRLSGQTGRFKSVVLSETGYIRGELFVRYDGMKWRLEDWEMPFGNWPGKAVPLEKDMTRMGYSY